MTARRGRGPASKLLLVVAGSDPSGGAGLELDLKVLARLHVHGAAVATCHTLQSAAGMRGFRAASTRHGERQLDLLRRDAAIGAVKIGMLPNADWVALAARTVDRLGGARCVVDPVLAPTIGPRVLPKAAVRRLVAELLPRADLLTPNALEAAELLGVALEEVERDPDAAARALVKLGPRAVLLKGGHLRSGRVVVDRLRGAHGDCDFVVVRRRGAAPRGTGCALSSAIAAGLLRGRRVVDSIEFAATWLQRARAAAVVCGRGRPYLGLVSASFERAGSSSHRSRRAV